MGPALSSERWAGNWRMVSPAESTRVMVGRGRRGRQAAVEETRALAAGTPVVLVAGAPGAGRRAGRVAARAGIRVEREYLALPSAERPAYLIEDARSSFRVFVDAVLGSPGQGVIGRIQDVAVALIRRTRPRRVVAMLGAGRVVVGKRP